MSKVSWTGGWLPVLHRLPKGGQSRRAVALTIDDGPSDSTLELLDVLSRYGAKATFFLSGIRILERPEVVEAIVAAGHHVYAHGHEHVHLDECEPERIARDLTTAENLLARWRPAPRPYLVRLPYAAGRRLARVHAAIRAWAHDAQIAHWSLSTEDHTFAPRCRERSELISVCAEAAARIIASPRLDGAVLLMHDQPFDVDGPFRQAVAPILAEVLVRTLTAAGYALVPLQPLPRPTYWSSFLLEK